MNRHRTDMLYQNMAIEAAYIREEQVTKMTNGVNAIRSLAGANPQGGKNDTPALLAQCQIIEEAIEMLKRS